MPTTFATHELWRCTLWRVQPHTLPSSWTSFAHPWGICCSLSSTLTSSPALPGPFTTGACPPWLIEPLSRVSALIMGQGVARLVRDGVPL